MGIGYGAQWTKIDGGLRQSPTYTPPLLIQAESAGLDDSVRNRSQIIQINGVEVLNATAPRSYRASRLINNNGWSLDSSNGYDVYGSGTNATNLNTYLQGFNNNDILVLTTYDEPNRNRTTFRDTLINDFGAQLQNSGTWASRCSYLLIASKSKGPIVEKIQPRFSARGIEESLWLG